MKKYFLLIIISLRLNVSIAQLSLASTCGSNANFALEYIGFDRMAVAHFSTLEFYDLTNINAPFLITTLPLSFSYPVIAMHASNNLVFTHGYNTPSVLSIVDISNINNPYVIGTCFYGSYTGHTIQPYINSLYVLGYDSIYLYNILNLNSPQFVAAYDVPGAASAKGMFITNQMLGVMSDAGLCMYPINSNGTLAGYVLHPGVNGNNAIQFDPFTNTLFTASSSTLKSYDVTNISNPVFKYQLSVSGAGFFNIYYTDGYLYSTGNQFDVFRPTATYFSHVATLPNTYGQSIDISAKDSSYIMISTVNEVRNYTFDPNSTVSMNEQALPKAKPYIIQKINNTVNIQPLAEALNVTAYDGASGQEFFRTNGFENGVIRVHKNSEGITVIRILERNSHKPFIEKIFY